jgi:hypothetical protein
MDTEMKDRGQKDLELFAPFKNDLKKKTPSALSPSHAVARSPRRRGWRNSQSAEYIPAEK